MPKVAYSEEERAEVRQALLAAGLEQMAKQGIQHTTVEQIYRKVGISRTFFYTFFPSKEDFAVEILYMQQPRIVAYAKALMADEGLAWRERVRRFLHACCYGEQNGIAVLTLEEQQQIFRRLSPDSRRRFRDRQVSLFGTLLTCFGVRSTPARVQLFTNLCLAMIIMRRAIPESLPFLVPEAADESIAFQIDALVRGLEEMRRQDQQAPLP